MKLLFILVYLVFTFGVGQDLRIGVIVPSGDLGKAQLATVATVDLMWQDPFGRRIELLVRESSNPTETKNVAAQLVEAEAVHLLICCNSTTAAEDVAAKHSVLILSPNIVERGNGWLFSSRAGTQRLLQAVLLRFYSQGKTSVALMTPEGDFGDATLKALTPLTGAVKLSAVARYPLSAEVLTPESLWTISQQPDAIIVWGLAQDSQLAYDGLRQRGYTGDIVLNPAVLANLKLGQTEIDNALLPVHPLAVGSKLTPAHASFEAVETYLASVSTAADPYLYDALMLAREALGQALVYGVSPDNLSAFRSASRDALVTAGPIPGVTAIFDYSEGGSVGVDPYSLLVARLANGVLEPAP